MCISVSLGIRTVTSSLRKKSGWRRKVSAPSVESWSVMVTMDMLISFKPVIDLCGMVVGLPANAIQPGSGEHSGCDGVNVKVAAHVAIFFPRYEQPVKR